MRIIFICIGVVSIVFAAQQASAFEPLSGERLQEICASAEENTNTENARLCVFYIKGFLDGAVATDGRVAENVASEMSSEESFTERAIRTRVINRLRDFGPSVYAEFCVGQPDPIEDVVMHVIEELDRTESLADTPAQTIVYDSLKRHYPCEAD